MEKYIRYSSEEQIKKLDLSGLPKDLYIELPKKKECKGGKK